jgi:hypothetical protein
MKQSFAVLLLLISFSFKSFTQAHSSHTRISIITCSPGDELYSLFGHTALRIIDSLNNSDIVYNWGTFSFDEPNFYLKFLRGNLLYYVSAYSFSDFLYEYSYEHRSVYEQVLNTDSSFKRKILDAVDHNMQGSNRFYKYDFLLDNCTTRVKNIVFENAGGATITTEIVPHQTTSRDLIHYYLERGGKPWTQLGIDILLGSRVDRPVSNDEAMFLPEFFMKGLGNAQKTNKPVAMNTKLVLQGEPQKAPSWKFIPLLILTILSLSIFFISTIKQKWAIATIKIFDALLLYITGLVGVLIMFMWFATDHTVCQNNFNIAWALPVNLVAAFSMTRRRAWLQKYFFITAIITALMLATWFWIPQQLNLALLPVILLLLNRYVKLAQLTAKP